jgi:hypothetical protein
MGILAPFSLRQNSDVAWRWKWIIFRLADDLPLASRFFKPGNQRRTAKTLAPTRNHNQRQATKGQPASLPP